MLIGMGNQPKNILDCLIIGGGQSGIAVSYACKKRSISHAVLEAHDAIGDNWRERYDSLRLFTPRCMSTLDNMAMPGDPDGFPAKDEMAAYFEQYTMTYVLPVELSQKVSNIRYDTKGEARFITTTGQGQKWYAKTVVIATGPYQIPFVPSEAQHLNTDMAQFHSSNYHNCNDVHGNAVLIAGCGNSGAQIAVELAESGKNVTIAAMHPLKFAPAVLLGKSLFWWQNTMGSVILYAPTNSRRGRFLKQYGVPIVGMELKRLLEQGRVIQKPAVTDAQGHEVQFADGSRQQYDTVVWCTGFRGDYPLLRTIAGALDDNGLPVHTEGISPVPGLFYAGQEWQRSRASSLVLGASRDAEFVVGRLAAALSGTTK